MVLLPRIHGVKRGTDICNFRFLFVQVYKIYDKNSALDSVDVKYCGNVDG